MEHLAGVEVALLAVPSDEEEAAVRGLRDIALVQSRRIAPSSNCKSCRNTKRFRETQQSSGSCAAYASSDQTGTSPW